MELAISKIISSVVEILALGALPFVWWFFTARKKTRFMEWIGLKKIGKQNMKSVLVGFLYTLIPFIILTILSRLMVKDVETALSEFEGLGMAGLLPALIYAVFNTSFPEELFFRGFLQKRLSVKMGYLAANIVQSLLFGLMHGAMFFGLVGLLKGLLITALTGVVAFMLAAINETKADGSILPSWSIHACANISASVIALFSIF